MNLTQVTVLALLGVFYIAYFTKAFMQRQQGITTNLLGKGNKPKAARNVEYMLRAATLVGGIVQFISAIFPGAIWSFTTGWQFHGVGVALMLFGIMAFIAALFTMKDNWRAGFSSDQKTELVTNGIYRYSRNPAFVGFDLLYIGCAFAFPNIINIMATLFAAILFHIQIKGEEVYLYGVFGKQYVDYSAQVSRYIGRQKALVSK